jgi:hypothetical protein
MVIEMDTFRFTREGTYIGFKNFNFCIRIKLKIRDIIEVIQYRIFYFLICCGRT